MIASETTIDLSQVHACILAGGRSSRMGRNKAGVLLGGQSLLQIAINTVEEFGISRTVITEDVVPKCGPLGGIITGIEQTTADRIILLPCDMPFVPASLLREAISKASTTANGACVINQELACFPMCFNRSAQAAIREQHDSGDYSLQNLVKRLDLAPITSTNPEKELFNINTEDDLMTAMSLISESAKG